jgi:beta-galactosidase
VIGYNARTGVLEIKNKQDFDTLAWIRCEWEFKLSGKRVSNGKLPVLKTAPQKVEKIDLKIPTVTVEAGQEAFLNLRFYAAAATGWCKGGHEVGWDQVSIPAKIRKAARSQASRPGIGPLTLDESNGIFTVENKAFHLVASAEAGFIEALRSREHEVLA